jgi:glycosyltransferase involved in cell wall biosynthesis
MPLWLPRADFDAAHWTGHDGPLFGSTPAIVTVHDVTPITHPELHPPTRVARSRFVLPRLARRAAAVITVSGDARAAIIDRLGVSPSRVHVVPLAASSAFAMAISGAGDPVVPNPRTFLFVGTIEPRKNVARVLDALALLRREPPGVRLVIVGRPGWRVDLGTEIARRGLARAVVWHRDLADDDLAGQMLSATALVVPSIAEGFGLPIVEAMAAGLPVITSRGGAQEETAGGAALLVDPLDSSAIADAMRRVATETDLRSALRARGLARAADFSWVRTAADTLAVYQTVTVGVGQTTA